MGGEAPEAVAARSLSRTGFLEGLAVDDLVAVDLPVPGAGRALARFDELLEPLQVALHLSFEEAQVRSDRLDDAFGIGVQLQGHARPVAVQWLEQDGPRVLIAIDALPGDPRIGRLVGDLRGPLLAAARDLRCPLAGRSRRGRINGPWIVR